MSEVTSNRPRPSRGYLAWLTATLAGSLAVLGVVGWALSTHGVSRSIPTALLKVDPPTVDFGVAGFAEGSPVKGTFRLVNTSERAVTVRALNTSCSCLASVVEGGKAPPFAIEPSSSAVVQLATTANSFQGLHQSYSVVVMAGPDGAEPRSYEATVKFDVVDSLKADPPAIRLYEASPESPTRASISLYTSRDSRVIPEPTARVRDSDRIEVNVFKSRVVNDHDRKTLPRYEVVATFLPSANSEPISGTIEITTPGEPTLIIPCSCQIRRDQTVEPDRVDLTGKPGETFERRLFQQFHHETWREPRVAEQPQGCQVEIRRFDDRTNLILIKLTVPRPADSRPRDGGDIVLASRDGARTVRIPVRYTSED